MYKNILVPIAFDHGEQGTKAFAVARQLLDEGGKITLLHVMETLPSYAVTYLPEGTLDNNRARAFETLSAMKGKQDDHVSVAVVGGHANSAIIDHAKEHGADCIIIASHKPGLEDYFIGSTAARVVRHADCCVHVLR